MSGRGALGVFERDRPDLIVLDLALGDIDGIEICRLIRDGSATPIIVLSARGKEPDKVAALDAGADDYVTKPFATGELLARIRAALRHAARAASGLTTLRIGAADVDLQARTARRGDEELRLTPIEFRLLATLAKHLGMVVTHRQLLTEIWGPTHAGDTHYLRIYMKQLRDKFGDDAIRPRHFVTETGVGYRLLASE